MHPPLSTKVIIHPLLSRPAPTCVRLLTPNFVLDRHGHKWVQGTTKVGVYSRTYVGAGRDKNGCIITLVERGRCTHPRAGQKWAVCLGLARRGGVRGRNLLRMLKNVAGALRRAWTCGPRFRIMFQSFLGSWADVPRTAFSSHPLLSQK